jgi:hypothetical protein
MHTTVRKRLVAWALFLVLGLGALSAMPDPAQAQGVWPWTSYRLATDEDLGPLSIRDLEIMRNEIYARHGWIFARRDLQAYFFSQPWYQPRGGPGDREWVNREVEASLSRLERENIRRIKAYEDAKRAGSRW